MWVILHFLPEPVHLGGQLKWLHQAGDWWGGVPISAYLLPLLLLCSQLGLEKKKGINEKDEIGSRQLIQNIADWEAQSILLNKGAIFDMQASGVHGLAQTPIKEKHTAKTRLPNQSSKYLGPGSLALSNSLQQLSTSIAVVLTEITVHWERDPLDCSFCEGYCNGSSKLLRLLEGAGEREPWYFELWSSSFYL